MDPKQRALDFLRSLESRFHRHTVEQRVCAVLVLVSEYLKADRVYLTHDSVSLALDIRRASVAVAAEHLRDRGLIDFKRGWVLIKDPETVKSLACQCYDDLKKWRERKDT